MEKAVEQFLLTQLRKYNRGKTRSWNEFDPWEMEDDWEDPFPIEVKTEITFTISQKAVTYWLNKIMGVEFGVEYFREWVEKKQKELDAEKYPMNWHYSIGGNLADGSRLDKLCIVSRQIYGIAPDKKCHSSLHRASAQGYIDYWTDFADLLDLLKQIALEEERSSRTLQGWTAFLSYSLGGVAFEEHDGAFLEGTDYKRYMNREASSAPALARASAISLAWRRAGSRSLPCALTWVKVTPGCIWQSESSQAIRSRFSTGLPSDFFQPLRFQLGNHLVIALTTYIESV